MRYYIYFNNDQYLFDRCLQVFWIVIKRSLKILIYSPLVFSGYILASYFLSKGDSAFAWISLSALFAFAIYLLQYFIKGMIIALKQNSNLFWLLLFFSCVCFNCVFPVWIIFGPVKQLMLGLSPSAGSILTWLFSFAFGLYVYSRYHFLTNNAPNIALPVYQAGIKVALTLLKLHHSKKLKAKTGLSK